MDERKLLLFADQPRDLATIGRALRDLGYLVFPARFHEDGADALVRVQPNLVLIDGAYGDAIVTPAFREHAERIRANVLMFLRVHGTDDAAACHQLHDEHADPILEYTGDGRALAVLVDEVTQAV